MDGGGRVRLPPIQHNLLRRRQLSDNVSEMSMHLRDRVSTGLDKQFNRLLLLGLDGPTGAITAKLKIADSAVETYEVSATTDYLTRMMMTGVWYYLMFNLQNLCDVDIQNNRYYFNG